VSDKALLFINGNPPEILPNIEHYKLIACTDGAFHYLKKMGFSLDKLDFISGDFDSHHGFDEKIDHKKFIFTPDQNKTDFQKALEIILEKGYKKVDVFGGSGGEQDHFLGNLTVAFRFKNALEIKFFDENSVYYFIGRNYKINDVKNKMMSLYPFPETKNVITKGLNWDLSGETLSITTNISTRNFANEDEVEIRFDDGEILLFVGADYV
jgi:thiamine pyrophosphokinase